MKFWQKVASSFGGFLGRNEAREVETEDTDVNKASLSPVLRAAEAEYCLCSDCSLDLSDPGIYRGINISSASISSMGTHPGYAGTEGVVGSEQKTSFSYIKKIFSPTNSPKTGISKL